MDSNTKKSLELARKQLKQLLQMPLEIKVPTLYAQPKAFNHKKLGKGKKHQLATSEIRKRRGFVVVAK
jgi:hypothetical protein